MKKTKVVSRYRTTTYTVGITRGSYRNPGKWGCPVPLKSRDALDVVDYLLAHARSLLEPDSPFDDIEELRGEVLGCVCAPARCHGDTLARLADAADPRAELDVIIDELEGERAAIVRARGGVQQGLFGGAP